DGAAAYLAEQRLGAAPRLLEGPGYLGIDLKSDRPDADLFTGLIAYSRQHLHLSELHPDVWRLVVIREPAETEARLATVPGDRYSYRELDDFTDVIARNLQTLPMVTK